MADAPDGARIMPDGCCDIEARPIYNDEGSG
jgi:hypothetical protein